MKFFFKNNISAEQIKQLKRLRKRYVQEKVIHYNGNYVEHVNMEKSVRIRPKNDEILDLIEEYLEPWLDSFTTVRKALEGLPEKDCYYNYDKLPAKLKSFMFSVDSLLYANWYENIVSKPSAEIYNSRLDMLEKYIPDYTDEEFERYVLLGRSIPSSTYRKAKESARRAYRIVNGILKANILKFNTFMTFTFAPEEHMDRHKELNRLRKEGEQNLNFTYLDAHNFESAKKMYTQTMNLLSKKLKKNGTEFEYLAVWELQKNGAYHFHILCSSIPDDEKYKVPEWLDMNHKTKKRNNGHGLNIWKFGKSDVQPIKDFSTISTYVSKYIIKSFYNISDESFEMYMSKKKYFTSQGLDRPDEVYIMDDNSVSKELLDYKLDDTDPFTKDYTNPYNGGQIVKKTYTLITKKEENAILGKITLDVS